MNRKLKLVTAFFATSAILGGVAVAASSPSISTGATSAVTASSAVLHGTVNPNGATTHYQFQWGLTTSYGVTSPLKSAGGGTKSVAVQITATRLIPGTVYHYRMIALNRFGGVTGADRKFKTGGNPPPEVATGPPSQLGANFATVTGVINPHGEKTTWAFQYGTTPLYGFQTFGGVVPAGNVPVVVSQQLQGLQSGMFFHYRIVALHGSLAQYGADASFLTFPSPRPVPRVRAKTTPGRDRKAPYAFTTSGTISRPRSIPASLACFQNATVRFFLGKRQVAFSLVPIEPNCSFSGQTSFRHLPGRRGKKNRQVHLKVLIHFRGNGYLAPSNARPESVTLG